MYDAFLAFYPNGGWILCVHTRQTSESIHSFTWLHTPSIWTQFYNQTTIHYHTIPFEQKWTHRQRWNPFQLTSSLEWKSRGFTFLLQPIRVAGTHLILSAVNYSAGISADLSQYFSFCFQFPLSSQEMRSSPFHTGGSASMSVGWKDEKDMPLDNQWSRQSLRHFRMRFALMMVFVSRMDISPEDRVVRTRCSLPSNHSFPDKWCGRTGKWKVINSRSLSFLSTCFFLNFSTPLLVAYGIIYVMSHLHLLFYLVFFKVCFPSIPSLHLSRRT